MLSKKLIAHNNDKNDAAPNNAKFSFLQSKDDIKTIKTISI